MDEDRAANIIGAFASTLGDRLAEQSQLSVQLGASAPAALAAIANYDAPSIERLRRILGLSHPGSVRLVDRLRDAGLVERRPTPDARTVALRLTRRGRARVERLFAERRAVVDTALAGLAPAERDQLLDLMGRLLDATLHTVPAAERTCRLCRHDACTATGGCPIAV